MMDRGMKKWKPFSAVVPNSTLISKEENVSLPTLSMEEIEEAEEILKASFYTRSKIKCFYIEDGKLKILNDYVVNLDPIKKNVYFKTKTINFRQIKKIED